MNAIRSTLACLLFSLTVAAGVASPGAAQEKLDHELTGGASRAWILRPFIRAAVPGDNCSSGEIYTFAVTHDLLVSRCEDGHIVQRHYDWSLTQSGDNRPMLSISTMGTFALTSQTTPHGSSVIRLRAANAAAGQPAVERELRADEN